MNHSYNKSDYNKSDIEIKLYQPFGSSSEAYIFGHIFRKQKLKKERVSRNILKNALEMLKRYQVKMAGNESIIIEVNSQSHEVRTDRKGYFFLKVETPPNQEIIHFTITSENVTVQQQGEIRIRNPKQIFISDIDDTILVSHSTSLLKKIYTLLSRNHERRRPFEGVQSFYRKLAEESSNCAFFYVSSSEWNLYDFIDNFCRFNQFPEGCFLLNDIKVGLFQVIRSGGGSHDHKYEKIKLIRDTYPKAKLTLIGDSGQQDPEIYERIAMESPDRIKEIYIRDLKKRNRKDLLGKQSYLAEHRITMHLFN